MGRSRAIQDRVHQASSDPSSLMVLVDVDRDFRRVIIGASIGPRAEGYPADDAPPRFSDEERVPCVVPLESRPLGVQRSRLSIERRYRSDDRLIVDPGNGRRIVHRGGADDDPFVAHPRTHGDPGQGCPPRTVGPL